MGEIARTARVSKGTLYVYFDSKEQLFEAVAHEACAAQAEAVFSLDPLDRDGFACTSRLRPMRDCSKSDCEVAAAQFLDSCVATMRPLLFNASDAPTEEQIDNVVAIAVRTFLAAYRRGMTLTGGAPR